MLIKIFRFQKSLNRSKVRKKVKLYLSGWSKEDNTETNNEEAINSELLMCGSKKTLYNKEIQCNFIEEISDNCKLFICNRICANGVCEAETQAYIPYCRKVSVPDFSEVTHEQCCGDDKEFQDTCVGPGSMDSDNYLLDCVEGFPIIKTEQDLLRDTKEFQNACNGSNPMDSDNYLLDCAEGLHGFQSIKSEKNLLRDNKEFDDVTNQMNNENYLLDCVGGVFQSIKTEQKMLDLAGATALVNLQSSIIKSGD